jgi:ATP-dependent protease HslVU (ClpYQ) peptidase subunit
LYACEDGRISLGRLAAKKGKISQIRKIVYLKVVKQLAETVAHRHDFFNPIIISKEIQLEAGSVQDEDRITLRSKKGNR